jgi:lipoprotein-anchoring transpeptidase ErfK/SrfK
MRAIRPFSRGAVAAVAAVVVLGVGGAVVAATQLSSGPTAPVGQAGPDAGSAGRPTVLLAGLKHGHVPWNAHLTLQAQNASLRSVLVTQRNGTVIDGVMDSDSTRWRSATRLVPQNHYQARVVLRDGSDAEVTKTLRFRATDSHRHLTALLSPGDGDVVGVGSPVIVRLSRPVADSQRAAVQHRLAVSTTPSVVGAWHWMSDQELHWRPPTYWKAHTAVTVSSHFGGLYLGKGVWGVGDHQTTFKIGDSHISRVDAARHEMYVYQNRKLIHTFPISAGRDQYPTKSGVHITFERSQVVTMDSATVGIPRDSPDGYYEQVYWDVRISYGGAFVHAAPWSVAQQGLVNVSHGCVNLSTTNAEWFYNWSLHGDIVDVYNTSAAPDLYDPGMSDWNMSWKKWVAGDADPTTDAVVARPPLPRDSEPKAPAAGSAYTPPPSQDSSPSPSPSPSHKPHRTSSPSPSPSPHHSGH